MRGGYLREGDHTRGGGDYTRKGTVRGILRYRGNRPGETFKALVSLLFQM